jgi:MYXO-CTERM domain-containing protein
VLLPEPGALPLALAGALALWLARRRAEDPVDAGG